MELRPSDLAKEWKAGTFRPFYYFVGEESAAKSDALAALKAAFQADDFNLREFHGPPDAESSDAVSEATTLPVFADKRLVIVHSQKLGAGAMEVFAQYLKDPLPSTTLVLMSEDRKPDLKDPLVKAAAKLGGLCLFAPMRDDEAAARLRAEAKKAGKELSEEAASLLVEEAGADWGILRQELEKALLYSGQKPGIDADAVVECLGYQKAADPFALTRLVQDRKVKDCLAHFRRMLKNGKPDDVAFRSLSQISGAVSKQLRAKRMLAARVPSESIGRALRLHPYWDKDFLPKAAKFSEPRLLRDLKRCLDAEVGLKSKTWLDPRIEIERLLVDVCRS